MNRRFSVPSTQPPHLPQRRIQHLPDDFANFVPSGNVRRNSPASSDISVAIPAPAAPPLAVQSQPTQISSASTSPEPAATNISGLDPAPAPDRSPEVLSSKAASPELASAESQHDEILPPPTSEISAPGEVFLDEVSDESWAESLPADSFLSSISKLLGPEAASELTAVLRPRDSALFNTQFDSLSEMHCPDSSASPSQSCSKSNVAAASNATSIPQKPPSRKFQKTARKRMVTDPTAPSLSLHRRKCVICRHPEREMIEMYFIRWRSAHRIARDFDLSGTSVVYRHANALGLFAQRSRNIRSMLEVMFEQVANVTPTADALIRAVRTYASLTDHGEWVEPATTHVVTTSAVLPGLPAAARPNLYSVPSTPPPASESLPSVPTAPSSPIFEIPIAPASSGQHSEPPQFVDSNRECSPIKKHRKLLETKESTHV